MRSEPSTPTPPSVPPEPNLAGLLARAAAGDAEALGAFYDATRRRTFGVLLRAVGDRGLAEEALVDVYEQVWRIASTYDPARGGAEAWLFRLARCRAIDLVRARLRLRRRTVAAEAAYLREDPRPDAPRAIESAEQTDRLAAVVNRLPEAQRRAIETAYFGGLSYAESAQALGVPLGTVKTRMRAALAALRAALPSDVPHRESAP
jgi:RNA polymerase sigma-70 factor, ECF subfamily